MGMMERKGNYYLGLGFRLQCRPMINNPPPFKCVNIRIPIIIPIKGRGFMNQGSGLPLESSLSLRAPSSGPNKIWKHLFCVVGLQDRMQGSGVGLEECCFTSNVAIILMKP